MNLLRAHSNESGPSYNVPNGSMENIIYMTGQGDCGEGVGNAEQTARPSSQPMTRGEWQGESQQFLDKDETNDWTASHTERRMT